MLNFFRKYQKIFFIIVTIFVVISFCFFGTFGTYTNQVDPDKVIGKTASGSPITLRELDALHRLLGTSYEERTTAPNLFNDGVVRKDFLNTGMGIILAEKYFEEIQKDLEPRLKKAKYFKPYVHPKAPFISAELTWQQYFPGMSRDLALLKAHEASATKEEFQLLVRLYLAQMQLPPDSLKQILLYQMGHYQNLPPDPGLQSTDLSLFGFHSLEDWFGPHFLDRICHFILHSADKALEKGYQVTLNEARADLIHNVQTALLSFGIEEKEAPAYFQQQLRVFQLDENTVTKAWRKVMLFRRLFHDVGNAIVVDPFLYKNFETYAHEGVSVELYQLPEELRLSDMNGLLKLQTYLEAVSSLKEVNGGLPTSFLSSEQVEKRFPELIERSFVVTYSQANKEKLAAQISLKETWEWELDDRNWEQLQNAFFFEDKIETKEERFKFLESLDPKERLKVDGYARMKIVDAHPEWLKETLDKAEERRETLSIRSKGGKLPLIGINHPETLADLLHRAFLKESEAQEQLSQFTEDGIHYYRLHVIESSSQKRVVNFSEVSKDGTLQEIVDRRLESAYPDVRRKDSAVFQASDGSWKPFYEVKEEIGKRLYHSMMVELQNKPASRLTAFMQQAKKHIEAGADDSSWIRNENDTAPVSLQQQWSLLKSSRVITRASQEAIPKEGLLHLPVGSWSEVETPDNGDLFFAYIKDKVEEKGNIEPTEGQGILSIGARRFLMNTLLDEMMRHGT